MNHHPIANIFPLLGEDEIVTLSKDIKENGLKNPIVLFEGQILDGRNRHAACLMAGVDPRCVTYSGKDPEGFVASLNLHRRHLTTSERAIIAARLAKETNTTIPEAAKAMNVSERSVQRAKNTIDTPKEEKIASGEVSVASQEIVADKTGAEIPVEIREDWIRSARIGNGIVREVRTLIDVLESGLSSRESCFRELDQTDIARAKSLLNSLELCVPYAVCPSCLAVDKHKCMVCKSRGWISKPRYEQTTPESFKKMRKRIKR